MTTAILSALPEEQAGLHELLQGKAIIRHAGRDFWCGQLSGQPVVLAQSGIGKVAAATTATVLAERFGVQRIVFTGVAGGLAPQVRVGDVVVGSAYLQHDMDASPIFPKYEAPGYQRSRFTADAHLLAIVSEAAYAVDTWTSGPFGLKNGSKNGSKPTIHQGLIISGDRFVSTTAESAALQAALPDALCVEMEGAAVAQVCCDYALPFVAVRSISDRADDNAHQDFPQFLRTVAAPLSQALVCKLMALLAKL
jgi:adenosylhomocysteine nucleosidase